MNGYETIDQIMQQLRYIFDGQTAKEVLEAYLAYLLCGNPPYPAWKKHISVQNLSNRRIRRYLVCRLKRPEARDFSHVRFTQLPAFSWTNFSLILRSSRQNITV